MFQYKQYLTDFTNFLELLLYGSTLTFVSVFDTSCLCPTNYQWQFGILAVFLGWINLLLFVQKFPGIGIYIVMFLKICKTFLRTVVLLLLLLMAFGLAFYMAFDEPQYEVSEGYNWFIYVLHMSNSSFTWVRYCNNDTTWLGN